MFTNWLGCIKKKIIYMNVLRVIVRGSDITAFFGLHLIKPSLTSNLLGAPLEKWSHLNLAAPKSLSDSWSTIWWFSKLCRFFYLLVAQKSYHILLKPLTTFLSSTGKSFLCNKQKAPCAVLTVESVLDLPGICE